MVGLRAFVQKFNEFAKIFQKKVRYKAAQVYHTGLHFHAVLFICVGVNITEDFEGFDLQN